MSGSITEGCEPRRPADKQLAADLLVELSMFNIERNPFNFELAFSD